jgi:hypothetical protein
VIFILENFSGLELHQELIGRKLRFEGGCGNEKADLMNEEMIRSPLSSLTV